MCEFVYNVYANKYVFVIIVTSEGYKSMLLNMNPVVIGRNGGQLLEFQLGIKGKKEAIYVTLMQEA